MKKLFIGIDFSKEKLDATIILACGMNEIGSREYGCFPNNTTGYRKLCNWVKTNAWNTTAMFYGVSVLNPYVIAFSVKPFAQSYTT